MSSTNYHGESGAPPVGSGNDSLPATNENSTALDQSQVASTVSTAGQNTSAQPNPDSAVTGDAKPANGGDSAAPALSSNNTTQSAAVAPSSTATPVEAKEQLSDAQAKETEDSKDEDEEDDSGPSLMITLLLTSGSRHPFKIDGKYLRKQSIKVENNDPFNMSVYTLKELIWREWRPDWESRPSSPSFIRLISFGKLLEDKAPLSASKFNHDAPNVVHMTIKPQEMIEEEDTKGAKAKYTGERDPSVRSPGCRCVIL